VVPLFAGFDNELQKGMIYEYDITGGTFAISDREPYQASGSGSDRARTTFEHFYEDNMSAEDAQQLLAKSLRFAAKKDAATGGEECILMTINAEGVSETRLSMEG